MSTKETGRGGVCLLDAEQIRFVVRPMDGQMDGVHLQLKLPTVRVEIKQRLC